MAIRNLRINEDEVLRKKCREVDNITDRIKITIKDMIETMYDKNGVGLAAPQVGILRRIFVIDAQDGEGIRVFINPQILETKGSQKDIEGCLSLPGRENEVERANYVKIKALDENGEEFVLEGEGLLARAIQHENDHLDGILFIDR
ncbi:MAG: peptide deformylase [Sarcina ventriculi]|uniref:Peptide deformylase n=1 Tax=Candidatus Sarcina troglodytae TaxID=2726954 RepID=A0ACD1BDW7_9CLOT|nr:MULTISPECIES: peptide deformylase [Sarcina]MCI5636775.1 peptide deformylase [Sarcina ventriculi]MDD7373124.1 peptide deformylase [Sarcina ventriculi]MDY7063177.1 peptide deformylase [Sarcina ventriculi]QPJ85686.1 peptide deformylase [Sarcina sp. JB2]SPZ50355.1 Peptide deformylase 1 [Sarcina ventriculi]